MAIELDMYGFRINSKPSVLAAKGKDWFEQATNKMIDELFGLDNEGYASNLRKQVSDKTGWIIFSQSGERKPRSNNGSTRPTKIKGCLPRKVMYRIAKELGLDLEESDEPGWNEWKLVSDNDPDFEGFSMVRLAGGEESDGGKSYRQWIDSNRANDRAIAEKLARESDPTFKLQQKIASLVGTIAERDAEITRLESELESAKLSSKPQRGPVMGGDLDQAMLRLMKQRFHPDRNNGDPETATKVMQWLNAIVL